ncbi:MAG: alpha/beta hydrolase [Actinobacteria bacterium]|nr:alpha/beta hydrolase [Actinomycetota bacterium]
MSSSFTTSDGRRLGYRMQGSGPLLVCHPGGPGFSSRYFGDLAGLGESLTLVCLHPRGTEGSDRPADPRAYTLEDYVADLEELRLHLGVERIDLLGHSHGGVVAMVYAAAHSASLDRLVLASTLPRFASEQETAMQAAMRERAGEPWYDDAQAALEAEQAGAFASDRELADLALREFPLYFGEYDAEAAAYLETLREETPNGDALLLFNKEIVGTFDLRSDLALIEAPALVITGERDFITGPVSAAEIAAGIPHARKVVIPRAGHFIFVEARERFRDEVLRFLARP